MTSIAILGSTGSIGRQTLEVVQVAGGAFRVAGLAAGRDSETLRAQLAEWPDARVSIPGARPGDLAGRWVESLEELAVADGIDVVVVATTGMAALPAVLAALRAGRVVALANKETLVAGGHLVDRLLPAGGDERLARLRPIDSEHSAIWQCLVGEPPEGIARLVLTASGGPFRDMDSDQLGRVTPEEALAHPTWQMGPKVTIDSATLVNKAFEVIEARWLYRMPYSRIDAVIHPQSVVHSLVEFADGSYKAQLGLPDMRLPIQYALTYPNRVPSPARREPPAAWPALTFSALDAGRFPAYDAIRAGAERGGNRGAVVNAADEVAVAGFLAGRIGFDAIAQLIDDALAEWGADAEPALGELFAVDAEVRTALARRIGLEGAA